MAVTVERIHAIAPFREQLPLHAEGVPTPWDAQMVDNALEHFAPALAREDASVFARIGFASSLTDAEEQDTLHLLVYVEDHATASSVREAAYERVATWNGEAHPPVEIRIKAALEEDTKFGDESTHAYSPVYVTADTPAPVEKNGHDDADFEHIHGLSREQRRASRERSDFYDTHDAKRTGVKQAKRSFDWIRLKQANDYQPSQDHTRLSSLEPQTEDAPDNQNAKTQKPILQFRSTNGQLLALDRALHAWALREGQLPPEPPLSGLVDQRPKHFHGFARKGQLDRDAQRAAAGIIDTKLVQKFARRYPHSEWARLTEGSNRLGNTMSVSYDAQIFVPQGQESLFVENPFMERFFADDGELLKKMAKEPTDQDPERRKHLTNADRNGMRVFFVSSLQLGESGKPSAEMRELTDDYDYPDASVTYGNVREMYRKYNRSLRKLKKTEVKLTFARVISDRDDVLLELSYIPKSVTEDFRPIDPFSTYGANLGIHLPEGEIQMSWSGKKLKGKREKEFYEDFFTTRKGRDRDNGTVFSYRDGWSIKDHNHRGAVLPKNVATSGDRIIFAHVPPPPLPAPLRWFSPV